jgi:hypothetical protein
MTQLLRVICRSGWRAMFTRVFVIAGQGHERTAVSGAARQIRDGVGRDAGADVSGGEDPEKPSLIERSVPLSEQSNRREARPGKR